MLVYAPLQPRLPPSKPRAVPEQPELLLASGLALVVVVVVMVVAFILFCVARPSLRYALLSVPHLLTLFSSFFFSWCLWIDGHLVVLRHSARFWIRYQGSEMFMSNVFQKIRFFLFSRVFFLSFLDRQSKSKRQRKNRLGWHSHRHPTKILSGRERKNKKKICWREVTRPSLGALFPYHAARVETPDLQEER